MNKFTKQYIKIHLETCTALYNAYIVLIGDEMKKILIVDSLKNAIESRLEQVLIELINEVAEYDTESESKWNEYRTHIKFYGIYSYDENGKEIIIVDKIIENITNILGDD